jgi:hypothetical protein
MHANSASAAYVIDPRFPGGTSSAVAEELRVVSGLATVSVHAVESQMFKDRPVAPQLSDTLDALGLELIWDERPISADVVILHNPSFLKFQRELGRRIFTRHLIVVTHENLLRPGFVESFDVALCLDQIDRASLALRKSIAPISSNNRRSVTEWGNHVGLPRHWRMLDKDWFNICDMEKLPPNGAPADRRGRHSRPGFEKFPDLATMDLCFSARAGANVILGGDTFLTEQLDRPHWELYPFRGLDLSKFFEMIDFMVYFTAPTWRESFGRVLAEAIAAGKVVISDPETASTFNGGVIPALPNEVDAIIADLVARPDSYRAQVENAQAELDQFSAKAFAILFRDVLGRPIEAAS